MQRHGNVGWCVIRPMGEEELATLRGGWRTRRKDVRSTGDHQHGTCMYGDEPQLQQGRVGLGGQQGDECRLYRMGMSAG